ncbi:triosephosphate isomerase [Cenarchaeum symbiosum A]|nr:triosephosphate isomerase [Cenarchaeum symbiosum A]
MLIINCKNYKEAAGGRIDSLAAAAAGAAAKYGVRIALAPPQHLLGAVKGEDLTVLAQHIDDKGVGSTTGYVVPELLGESGVSGALINHSEHRVSADQVASLVPRLRGLDMISVVCVKDSAEAANLSRHRPDYIAIEPPELIGSGRSVSSERPELIGEAAEAIRGADGTKLLCGAGITSGADVRKALELGSKGILVASGVVKSSDPAAAIAELAQAMS